jgi:ribosomal protein S18 acetylase RimI-like enzyme
MTANWQLRPAADVDLDRMLEISRAERIALVGYSDEDVTTVREQIAADPNFELGRDAVVAEIDCAIVGHALLNPRNGNIWLDPSRADLDGLREEFLAWLEQAQQTLGRPLRVGALSAHTTATGLLSSRGYEIERFYATMVREFALTGPPEAASLPEGYVVRPMERDREARALYEMDDRAFSALPDYDFMGFDEYVGRHLTISAHAPEWSFVIEAPDGSLAGSLIGERLSGRPHGYVMVLAVDPAHQRRGLGRALLLSAFAVIHAEGLPTAELHVASDNPRALELYTGVGMAERVRFNVYRRDR